MKVEEKREDVIVLKPTFMGMSMNLNELWRQLRKWLEGYKR